MRCAILFSMCSCTVAENQLTDAVSLPAAIYEYQTYLSAAENVQTKLVANKASAYSAKKANNDLHRCQCLR